MSRHMSKADEATSWRRTTALTPNEYSSSKSGGYHQRPASAGPTVHAASKSGQHLLQQLEPSRQPAPTLFSPEEARMLLEKRWSEVCEQGLQPTSQCNGDNSIPDRPASAAADGQSNGETGFLQALQKAVKVNSADAAWDDD